ncbi:FecCD family ABC transporter permease [Paenilisteria rocourtiae]|uniref:Iron complex transport system permease protein n=1 Tax=Listeria rocourtiae TaxID=647910 RepID=A0A4R6ZKI9_9LIST|nr:iron ABC transporter permease [Listeria rocourtiae]EUJ47761.1 transport system permease protein [Listeria rocourtiae FSL F6-920]MBC1604583.1 iron ABC transporter permease [Listeria rocourtiae]TDR52594.1 iron complex transport system permease protein [Listeria rocourtiae]
MEQRRQKSWILIGITAILLTVSMIVSVGIGSIHIAPTESIRTLFGEGAELSQTILWNLRIPRVLVAVIVGTNLAVSGAFLQAVMRNPLADPGLTGVSSGAAVTVLVIVLLFPNFGSLAPLAGMLGGLVAVVIVYALAWKNGKISPMRIILSGVAVNAIMGGIIGLLSILYSDRLPAVVQWMNGSLAAKGMGDVTLLLPYSVIGWIFAILFIRKANILSLGDDIAVNLGEKMNQTRIILSIIAVYLAAISVSVVGLLGFVGLVVPHMARFLVGSNYWRLIPMSMVLGAFVLLVADTIGRSLFAPLDIPAGIIMAIVGAPYFLYLMRTGDV